MLPRTIRASLSLLSPSSFRTHTHTHTHAVAGEDARERGELQRAYYCMLHVVVHTNLSGCLVEMPPGALDAVMKGVMEGAATFVDPAVRRTCLQVGGVGGKWRRARWGGCGLEWEE
jgi:hypothetical protein